MDHVEQSLQTAREHHQAGRLQQAEAMYREILAADANHAESLHLLGVICGQTGQMDAAVDLIRRAIAAKPNWPEANYDLGNALAGKRRFDEAIVSYRQAIALKPAWPEAHNNLGVVLKENGQLNEAIIAYRQAIVFKTDWPEAHNNLGNAFKDSGEFAAAIASFQQAIALRPKFPEAHNNLGVALRESGQLDQGIAACRQAIALRPRFAEAHNNLGVALKDKGQLDEAGDAYRQALAADPRHAQAWYNLGNIFKEMGQVDQAIINYRKALALRPGFLEAHNNLIYALHFQAGCDAQTIAEEHRRWNIQHAQPLQQEIRSHQNNRDMQRRLKVGYVSPDFRQHAESFFVAPLLREHDHGQFEIHCYASVAHPDAMTEKFKEYADVWHDVSADSDAQLAERIRRDGIDILVDLTMHMSSNRLLTFAHKPAPVQVTWLAYPGGTGLTTMDYRLTDAFMDPPGNSDDTYTEKSIRLPDCWCCYDPLSEPLPIAPPPSVERGYITFGSLNNFCKINQEVLTLWSRMLNAVPHSRLLLLAPRGEHRRRTQDFLEAKGIARERISFEIRCPREQYLQLYQQIDIAPDPFPYNGITTTCDALWMGVPVITLAGKIAASRAGLGLLSTAGLTEMVAQNAEHFVQIAAELATDAERLITLRSTLRKTLEDSPLCDGPRFARNVEAAYRQMWSNV